MGDVWSSGRVGLFGSPVKAETILRLRKMKQNPSRARGSPEAERLGGESVSGRRRSTEQAVQPGSFH